MSAGVVGMIMSMIVVVLMLVFMTVIVAVTMRVMAMVMMMIVTTVRAMNMALGGLFFGQQCSTSLTHVGIGFRRELIHASQNSKVHRF